LLSFGWFFHGLVSFVVYACVVVIVRYRLLQLLQLVNKKIQENEKKIGKKERA